MKVNVDNSNLNTQKKLSKDEIAQKIKDRFGDKAVIKKKAPVEDKAEIKTKGVTSSNDDNFGDIQKNSPDSEVTQEKLRTILKTGGFQFSDRERAALGEILN